MKPVRRLGEPMIAAVSFYLVLQWVAPVGVIAAPNSSSSSTDTGDVADQALRGNRLERSNTDGTPLGGLEEGQFAGDNQDHPGMSGSTAGQQAGQGVPGTAAPKGPNAAVEDQTQLREAKSKVAPHSMLIESALRSALGQADGVKAQIREAEASRSDAPLTSEQLSALSSAGLELASDLDTARLHRGQLRDGLQEFPRLSSSREFRDADRAFSELFSVERVWKQRMNRQEYWQNRARVNSDLALLQERIRAALSATRRFNMARLNIPESSVG